MVNALELQSTLREFPGQAAFWQRHPALRDEPTVLVRDHSRRRTGGRPAVTAKLADRALAAARTLTGDDPVLLRTVGGAVLALLAARAADRAGVTVFLPVPTAPGPVAARALPVTTEVTTATTGQQLLGALRADYLGALAHADIPVGAFLDSEDARPSDLMLALDGDLTDADADERGCPLLFDLRALTTDGPGEVVVSYDAGAFSEATAQRLGDLFARLFDALLADTARPLGVLLGPTDAEAALIAGDFNDTAADFPAERTLHSFLEERAADTPGLVAVADGNLTYGELNAAANRLARALRSRGVGADSVVGVCLPRSPRMLVAVYAVLKAGGAYVPLDPTLPRNRIEYILDHSGTSLVLVDEGTAGVVPQHASLDVADPAVAAEDSGDLPAVSGPDHLAYVIYTSGSTGRPKGVMVEHRAIVNRLWWMQRACPLGPDDTILHKTPFTFDVSVWEIFWWSMAGASVVTLPSGDEKNPELIAERIAAYSVTTMHFVPSMLHAFLQYVVATGDTAGLASLRRVFASGEALAVGHAQLFTQELGAHAELVNLYGPTEAAVDVSCQPCTGIDTTRPIPIGRPIDNIRLYVRTRDGGQAPIGTPGELCIAGTGLARGYLNAPQLTEERFVHNGIEGTGRLYRTGDLARWLADGTIEYLGRIDTQVKIRGYRIELGEIEHVAAAAPGVTDCAVTTVEDATGDRSLVAYVVPGEGYTEQALRAALASELPSYMVPQHLMEIDAVPTNHNGKRDLKALPAPVAAAPAQERVAPRTDVERTLAGIWAEVLGTEEIGVHDSFFALGGDSIKFIAVLARARAAGLHFTFQDLFAHPTVAELAHLAADGATAGAQEADAAVEPFALLADADRESLPDGLDDAYPMSRLQVGLIFEATRSDSEGMYHDILSYRIAGRVDLEVFGRAVAEVAQRHPVFRTSFHLAGFSEPVQLVHREAASPLSVADLRELSDEAKREALGRFATEELRAGFAYGTPDLVRIHLHLLGDGEYQYSLSYHDAALDGWSVNTIHRDVFATYFALLDGKPLPERHSGQSYRDFVALEQQAVASDEQRDFWLRLLDGAENTALPRLPDSDSPVPAVAIHDVDLPQGLSASVIATAGTLRVPVKSLLLAVHTAVLGFVAGTDDVLTGYEHSGRPEVEGGEKLAGLFLNTVPFRASLADSTTWAGLVEDVYRAETGMLPFRRFPMAEIKKAVGTQETLFESVFNFTHFHVLKDLSERDGFGLVRSVVNAQTEFPFRAEFSQDAVSDEVQLSLHFHSDVLTAQQIGLIGGYYRRALEQLVADPGSPRATGALLDEEERAALAGFSGPGRALPQGTFLDLFAEQVRTAPERTALVHGAQRLTYRDLDRAAERVAAHFAAHGVAPGSVVTTVLPRGVPWGVTVLALLKLGAVYLPQEADYPMERVAKVLRRSGCRHIVADARSAERFRPALAATGLEPDLLVYEEAAAFDAVGTPAPLPAPGDPAYLIFTSGSTGEPKGAVIRHSGMLNHLLAKVEDLDLTADDRVAQIATQCFDISVWQLLVAWLRGASTVIYEQEAVVEVPAFLRSLAEDRISVLEVVPSYLDAVLTETSMRPVALPELRVNLVTGEPLPPALTRRWFAQYPEIPLVNAYGPTEASDDVTHHRIEGPVDAVRVPVGRSVINTGIHVVGDDDGLRPLGSYGEIVVTGAGVGLGYVNDPDRTAAVFQPNTLDDRSETLYRTGDIGRWLPGGILDCAGRTDHQVKVRGYRIELSEIDGAVQRLAGVDGAVTLARKLAGETRLVTYYTGSAEPEVEEFRQGLAGFLPGYMHPEILVRLTEFPLTPNGKTDRKALEKSAVAPPVRHFEAPATDAEREVCALFAEALDLDPAEVSAEGNFFEIGGHSIAAMKVAALSDGRIALRDLLAHPTPRHLAGKLARRGDGSRELLTDLTRAAGAEIPDPVLTLVCVPFAGGSAVSYVPLARELADGGRVSVLGVELPGRTADDGRATVPIEQLAREVADEVAATARGPVAVLGHCAGSALGLLLVPELRERGVEVRGLLVVSKILKSVDPADHLSNEVLEMSDDAVLQWLVDNTGLDEVHRLSARERADLAGSFRYDTVEATRGFRLALTALADNPLGCPVTVAVATDDPLTAGRADAADTWRSLGTRVRTVVTDHGGHYLNVTRPAFLSGLFLEDLAVRN
ncbi:amino acid adenylation domain-containing protein [Streptomyces sp. B-S-A8]|uniref:Amino acid adenylation domain-containing protein n=1 Tax=Streptomyces solicavernae TaxID=3043614 RepID=A0ABT6S1W7_9ACTN|nr:non-ribosomal peptide synthetase [Streptomyces sp. B-S-A8]MDI3390680.1 amino acid adenylation domain-containing protein [Streptomyces sp. B-S-A8]